MDLLTLYKSLLLPGFRDLFTNVEKDYIKYSTICHPDLNENKELAKQTFALLQYRTEQIKNPVQVKIGNETYNLTEEVGNFSTFLLYKLGKSKYIKIAKKGFNKFLLNEFNVLTKEVPKSKHFDRYIPKILKKAIVSGRVMLLVEIPDDYVFLVEAKESYSYGIPSQHCAWIGKRLLEILSYVHEWGVVNAAIVPESMMVNKKTHGLIIVDWTFSMREGNKIISVPQGSKSYFPQEILDKKVAASTNVDIFSSAKLLRNLLDKQKINKRFDTVLKSWELGKGFRPENTWDTYDNFNEMLLSLYGKPKYVGEL